MEFIWFIIGVLIWFILLTKQETEIFVKSFGVLFCWVFFMFIMIFLVSINNKKITNNYKWYNKSISDLEQIVSQIQVNIQKCKKIKWFKKYDNLLCKNWKAYIKERNFNDVIISLQTYFKEYTKIHNFKNIVILIKFLKDKNMSMEKNFLYYKPIKKDALKKNKVK